MIVNTGAGDTIFALASGAGRAPVALIRLSGSATLGIVTALAGTAPPPRRASLRRLRSPDGEMLDQALVVWMPGPATYTGEDAAEFQVHGGPAVIQAVSGALVAVGARPAEPGEFTRRAFIHGRMDLLAAEGIADLVSAETEGQRRAALRQLGGAHSAQLATWAGELQTLVAYQEALIDFPDEDVPLSVEQDVVRRISALEAELSGGISEAARGVRLRDGLVFAVIGEPNVGKSSLVNALAEHDVAIVSDQPGTTRDALETRLNLGGIPVTLVDTAGLRETTDPVEQEGVRRAEMRAADADLRLRITVPGRPAAFAGADLLVTNKLDLGPAELGTLGVSARTGEGLGALRERLAAEAVRLAGLGAAPALSRTRHIAALQDAARFLAQARQATLAELRGEALRLALRALGRITGAVDAEALLDTIFAQFCIGK